MASFASSILFELTRVFTIFFRNRFSISFGVIICSSKTISFKKFNPIKIEGCKKNNKAFYGARCYKASIKNINGAVIIPDINKHKKDIIEFIAPINLKSELGIKDGDKIKIIL